MKTLSSKLITLALVVGLIDAVQRIEADPLEQHSGGLSGYITMEGPRSPDEFRAGASFYTTVWPLLDRPLNGFQIGLPSLWICPDNRDVNFPLCPVGTVARDSMPERAPTYRDVFQTIEGGLGFWCNTQFGSVTPKFRMNGTPDGYNHEISSPGWGFGKTEALKPDEVGLVQLSNRILVPPDGLTFQADQGGQVFGYAWMSLPLIPAEVKHSPNDVSTGGQSWTVFVNAQNFKGPVDFYAPKLWSRISKGYRLDEGRGLDSRPGLLTGGGMEINTVPFVEAQSTDGNRYIRIPQIQFPVDGKGRTLFMEDFTLYSTDALAKSMQTWFGGGPKATGTFDLHHSFTPQCSTSPIRLHNNEGPLKGFEKIVNAMMWGKTFGLQWSSPAFTNSMGYFPDYFKKIGDAYEPVSKSDVPQETGLTAYKFTSSFSKGAYRSPSSGPWSSPGPITDVPCAATLTDGSVVTYQWYRFIDQPSIIALGLDDLTREHLQKAVEAIHRSWTATQEYLPPPSSGKLAKLDDALIVSPPAGFDVGCVPIVIGQAPGN